MQALSLVFPTEIEGLMKKISRKSPKNQNKGNNGNFPYKIEY
jgi:hypothetical protein